MGEHDIFEALGVAPETTAPEGAKEQETAAPAAEGTQVTPEQAAPETTASEQAAPEPAAPEQATAEKGAEASEKPEVQGMEQRAAFAAERRRMEQKAAVDQAVAQALQAERERNQRDLSDFFAKAQLKNTLTGQPITSMEEFSAWEQAYAAEKVKRELQEGKLTPEAVQQLIDQTPAMRQVRELVQAQQDARRQEQQAAANARVEQELLEIGKLDPAIKSVEDLARMDNAGAFYELVKGGKTFLEAYKLLNFDAIVQKAAQSAAQAGKQQALNSVDSKAHLVATTGQRGTGNVQVPTDVMELFHVMDPGATDDEIVNYYNKQINNQAGGAPAR